MQQQHKNKSKVQLATGPKPAARVQVTWVCCTLSNQTGSSSVNNALEQSSKLGALERSDSDTKYPEMQTRQQAPSPSSMKRHLPTSMEKHEAATAAQGCKLQRGTCEPNTALTLRSLERHATCGKEQAPKRAESEQPSTGSG